MIFRLNSYTIKFKVSVVEWQRQNEASVRRPAKEFTDDRNLVHKWCQCYSALEQTHRVLGKRQPLSVDLDQQEHHIYHIMQTTDLCAHHLTSAVKLWVVAS